MVVLRAREENRNGGVVLTVNRITTLYPKDARGVINWFNNGLATNIDKEKAGQWITALQTHLGTDITKAELNSAAKVVQNFEPPKIEAENQTENSDIIGREGGERTQATDPVETFLRRGGGSRNQAPSAEQQEQMKGAAVKLIKANIRFQTRKVGRRKSIIVAQFLKIVDRAKLVTIITNCLGLLIINIRMT